MMNKSGKPRKKAVKKLECLFCLKEVENDREGMDCTETLFTSCFRHLSSDIVKKPSLEDFQKNNGPFCAICFQSAQQLLIKNELLTTVEKEINDFVTSLTVSMLENRNATVNAPFVYESNIDIQIHHRIQNCESIQIITDQGVIITDSPVGEEYDCYEVEIQQMDDDGSFKRESFPVGENVAINTENVIAPTTSATKPILKKIALQRSPYRKFSGTVVPVSCQCGASFENETKLIEHSITCSKNNLYLNESEKNEARSIRYRCGNCGFLALSLEALDEHKKRHFKMYPCNKCGEKFRLKRLLRVHMRDHRENSHRCQTCNRAFLSQRLLLEHKEKHEKGNIELEEEKPIDPTDLWKNPKNPKRPPERKCEICGMICPSKVHYNYHKVSKHSDETPYECTVCPRKFKIRRFLTTHMQTHVPIKDYLCAEENCGKSFASLLKLKEHTKLEHTDEHFKCELCGFKTLFQKSLENHQAHYHDPRKRFVCKVCGVRVSSMTTLQSHERIHTGEKPHECSTCGQSFRTTTLLKIHTNQTHATGKFKCPSCSYEAGTLSLLKSHSLIHSEEKPYECDKCHKRYKTKATVLKHQRISKCLIVQEPKPEVM